MSQPVIVGITGGIGSGKTTVSKYFKAFDIPIYHADNEAKALMNRSKVIKRKITHLFGNNAYKNDVLNRDYLRKQIFNDNNLLKQMNAIVHPKVGAHFKRWVKKQNAPYILKEAAIIFENNLEHQYDYIILVIADEKERIKRVMLRDNKTEAEVKVIIDNQLSDRDKLSKSDFVITNNGIKDLETQVKTVHKELLSNISSK